MQRITENVDYYRFFEPFKDEVFYCTQYDLYDRLKKDSYVIEKDLYVRIGRLRLILYHRFFCVVRVVFIGGIGSIWVLLEIENIFVVIYEINICFYCTRRRYVFSNNIYLPNYHFTHSKKPTITPYYQRVVLCTEKEL